MPPSGRFPKRTWNPYRALVESPRVKLLPMHDAGVGNPRDLADLVRARQFEMVVFAVDGLNVGAPDLVR